MDEVVAEVTGADRLKPDEDVVGKEKPPAEGVGLVCAVKVAGSLEPDGNGEQRRITFILKTNRKKISRLQPSK